MTKLTCSPLVKIRDRILPALQPNTFVTRRSLCAMLTVAAFIVVAYRPPSGGRTPPRKGTTTFTGTAEMVAKAPILIDSVSMVPVSFS